MALYILKRVLIMFLMLFLVSTTIFIMFRTMPGDPTASMVDPSIPKEAREALLDRYGLNDSLWVQYTVFIKDLVRLDLGESYFYNRPVVEVIKSRLPATLILMFSAMLIAYTVGVLGGAWMAWARGSKLESAGVTLSLIFRSAPTFWVGLMVIMIFAVKLNWFPAQGMRTSGYEGDTLREIYFSWDFVRHLILPAITAGLYFLATPMLIMRNSMLEVMSEDYIEMAHVKGLPSWRILYYHAARNALLPVVTAGALFIGAAIGGQVLIEVVFSWPGLGREIVQATTRSDYPVSQGAFIIISFVVMAMNLVADILYALLDPRISYD